LKFIFNYSRAQRNHYIPRLFSFNRLLDPEHVFYPDVAWLGKQPILRHRKSLYYSLSATVWCKVGIWWVISVQRTTGFMFFHKTNSKHCKRLMCHPSLFKRTWRKSYGRFTHDNKIVHTVNILMDEFDEVFHERVIHQGL
jgi:hypothetical protein